MFAVRKIFIPFECIKLASQVVTVDICALFFLLLEGLLRDCRELGAVL